MSMHKLAWGFHDIDLVEEEYSLFYGTSLDSKQGTEMKVVHMQVSKTKGPT